MNSIKRFTKRVKHTMFALALDTRGEHIATHPAVLLCTGGTIVAGTVGVTTQLNAAKANSDTVNSAGDTVSNKLSGMVSGGQNTTAATPNPIANQ